MSFKKIFAFPKFIARTTIFNFVLCSCLLQSSCTTALASDALPVLRLATGNKSGVYYPLGIAIAEVAKEANLSIEVLQSGGSIENLHWLSQGNAELCFAQSDAVYYAFHGAGRFAGKKSNIRAIASFYTEPVQIVIRKSLQLKDISEFKGKRISVGPAGGGSEANALAILEASGITINEIHLLNLNYDDTLKALNENKVDICFITSGIPSDVIKDILKNGAAHLFEIKPDLLARLIEIDPFFIITSIPAGTYAQQYENITTVGVSAQLVARADLPHDAAYKLIQTIFIRADVITVKFPQIGNINIRHVFKGIAIPVAEGALTFYQEKGLYRAELYKQLLNYVLALFSLLAILLAIKYRKIISYHFNKNEIARVFLVLLAIWVFGSIILYLSEHKINDNYARLVLSFWSSLINWISFGQKEPFTLIGRTTSVIMTILGIGGIAWLTGELASLFVNKKLFGREKKMDTIRNHYLIINWNEKGPGIVEQLHNADEGEKRPIIILVDAKEKIEDQPPNVFIVQGNPSNEASLKNANVEKAYSVIVLASSSQGEVSDAQSVLTILAIRKICLENSIPQIPIVAEIIDPQKVQLVSFASTKGNGYIEIVSSKNIEKNLLAHAAVNPGLIKLFDNLLTFDEKESEIHNYKIPRNFIGKKFSQLVGATLQLRDKGTNVIPVAVYRNGKMYVNPSADQVDILEEGDILFAICDKKEDLQALNNT
ncbi:MAG: TAXI family TRAP transporter solute-binding subunit [Syntrophaceae bacterium]|nr:TAXI family TRAP transporter solute-binding subunit [Syntrophaceae bacterium]